MQSGKLQVVPKKSISSPSRWGLPSWELRRPVSSGGVSGFLFSVPQGYVNPSEPEDKSLKAQAPRLEDRMVSKCGLACF